MAIRFGTNLRDKALLALEEAVQECRYRAPRRSFAIRFCLAYLFSLSKGDRQPFDDMWKVLGSEHSVWSFGRADRALQGIYASLGVPRMDEVASEFWRARQAEERGGDGPNATL